MKRLYKHFTKGWFHYSDTPKSGAQTGQDREASVVLRWPSPTEPKLITFPTPPLSLKSQSVQEHLSQSLPYEFEDVQPMLPKEFHPLRHLNLNDAEEEWRQILEYLNRNYPPGGHQMEPTGRLQPKPNEPSRLAAAAARIDKPKKIIPVTALRRLYDLFRDVPTQDFEKALYGPLVKKGIVVDLALSARRHLGSYSHNADDPKFHPRRPTREWWPRFLSDRPARRGDRPIVDFAKWLVAKAGRNKTAGQPFVRLDGIELHALDYEVNPLRTQRAIYEDGRPGRACGSGGIDLLLRHGRTPVIGEIKAATDTSLFKGLVQALVYTVELCSDSQRRRLSDVYLPGNHGSADKQDLTITGPMEICLFYEGDKPSGFTQAQALARSIVGNTECAEVVERIFFISCSEDEGEPVFSKCLTIAAPNQPPPECPVDGVILA